MSGAVSFIAAPERACEANARTAHAIRLSHSFGLGGDLRLQNLTGKDVEIPLTASALEAFEAVLERLDAPTAAAVGQRD